MTAFINDKTWLNFCQYYNIDGFDFFDSPELPELLNSDTDTIITIDHKYAGRIDLIAYDYLGDVEYWWFIALLNDLRILPSDLSMGRKIRIPTQETVSAYLKQSRGIQ